MTISKESAISFIRGDIDVLSNQSEASEILAGVNSIRGQLRLLLWTKVITNEEAVSIEDEMAQAREKAARRAGYA